MGSGAHQCGQSQSSGRQLGNCGSPPRGRLQGERSVQGLLRLSRAIDYVNDQFGVVANWLVLLACLISAGNAASRYLFSASSNAWLEVQWYMRLLSPNGTAVPRANVGSLPK